MANERWTGRVVKHNEQQETTTSYGSKENESLLQSYYKPLSAVVVKEDEGKTIRNVLEKHFGVSSKLLSQARLTEYGLTINEERVYISAPVQAGEIVRLRMLREQSEEILPQAMPLSILFEDEYLLIVNKPAGVVVHPTHGHYTNTLANGVVHYWQKKGELYRFRPIHRLDEETSGIVVIAKNGYIHQQLSEQMQRGEIDKHYVAFVYGKPTPSKQLIDAPIDRDPAEPHKRIVIEGGYEARTGYEVLQSFHYDTNSKLIEKEHDERQGECHSNEQRVSLVQLRLYTGRTHQIRVHMSSIGHPLLGDKLYYDERAAADVCCIERHALHAQSISLIHPMTKQRMEWIASLPKDLEELQLWLKKGNES